MKKTKSFYLSVRCGVTLIELLIAALIMIIAITGLVATWAQMMRTTLVSDNRGSIYELARQVMERSRSVGFYQNLPAMTVQPANNANNSGYTTPVIAHWRFFDEGMKEISFDPNVIRPTTPMDSAGRLARYCVETTTYYTPDANRVADRPDLEMLTIQVDVYDVMKNPNLSAYTLMDSLTQGGI